MKSKFTKVLSVLLVALILPFSLGVTASADSTTDVINAAIASGAHACNVSTPRSGNVFVQLYGTFDATAKDTILNQINGYRLEACQNGYPDPRNSSRKLTMADYVPIKWSHGLEEMAMLRSAEAAYTQYHIKITGETCWGSSYDVGSTGEVIAWSSGITSAISMWYSEKSAWTSGSGSVTGHYTQMIDPSNTYVGVAGFGNTQAGEFSRASGLDETKVNVSQYNSQLAEVAADKISSVAVTCNKSSIYSGTTATVSAICTMTAAGYSSSRSFTGIKVLPTSWTSGNTNIVKVDAGGNITGVAAGTAAVSCTVNGTSYGSNIRVTDVTLIKNFATRLYSVALNRTPDPVGLSYWTERLANKTVTGTEAAYGFFFSTEFVNSNLSNTEYILRLYRTFLGREPDSQGYAYWEGKLASGSSRLDVFYGFANSVEFAGICAAAGIDP